MSFIELKRGDNDKKTIWGGKKLEVAPSYTVTKLQTDLKSVGVYSEKIDGDFGKKTERALKIYQWCAKNSTTVLKNKALITYVPSSSIAVSGKCDLTTNVLLNDWVIKSYVVTGDLVRVDASSLSNIEIGSGYKYIGKPIVSTGEFVISKPAYAMIKSMNAAAKKSKVVIKINQALRVHGVKVTGSVVPPATKSQHLIGHAIDCNIVDGANWNTSNDFKKKKQTDGAKAFIKAMKKEGYRWGGDFSKVDTPHFDKQLSSSSFDYDAKFFLNQKQISSGEYIDKQIITK